MPKFSKDEFAKKLMNVIPFDSKYPIESCELVNTKKVNMTLQGITFRIKDMNISPIFYIDDLYKMYEKNDYNYPETVEEVIKTVDSVIAHTPTSYVTNINDFLNKNYVLQNVFPKVINAENNYDLLNTVPHKDIVNGLSCIYCINMPDIGGDRGSITINKGLMSEIGLTEKDLFNAAKDNYHIDLAPMNQVLLSMPNLPPELKEELEEQSKDPHMPWVLSNEEKLFGAASIAFPELLEDVKKTLGEDFYILPSSIHETLCMRASACDNIFDLENMVKGVNSTTVDDREFLSDNIFYYDGKLRNLSLENQLTKSKEIDSNNEFTEEIFENNNIDID